MTKTRQFVINGRYLSNPDTAVNSVARHLTRAILRAAAARDDLAFVVAVPPSLANAAEAEGVPYEVMGTRRGPKWEQFDLPRFLRGRRLLGFFNSVPLWGRGHITLLHDVHMFEVPLFVSRWAALWRRVMSRAAGRRGRRILTVSEYSRRRMIELGIGQDAQISVVYNGVDHIDEVESDRSILDRLELSGPFFTGLATLVPHKNSGLLLRAMQDPKLKNARLVLVGGHASASDFEAAGYPVPVNTVFTGFVNAGELRCLYEESAAVCLPSFFEGFGLPALEAMYVGTPAIVTDRTAPPELCGEGAYLAPPDDAGAWSEAMTRILIGSGEISPETCRAVAEKYTWKAAAERVLQVLDEAS